MSIVMPLPQWTGARDSAFALVHMGGGKARYKG